jgi:hypothetical protein
VVARHTAVLYETIPFNLDFDEGNVQCSHKWCSFRYTVNVVR